MKSVFKLATAGALLAAALVTTPAYAQEPPALAEISDPAEKERVKNLIEAAKKEGKLEWVGVFIEPSHSEKLHAAFREHYGLDDMIIEHTYVGTAELVTRVEQLLKAGNNNFDVTWTAAWAWYKDLLKRGEIMKYDSPSYKDYTLSDAAGMSEPGYWVSDGYTFSPMYNPDEMAKHGFKDFKVTSWNDFTNPKLKGLVSMGNVLQSTSYAPTVQGIQHVMGKDWMSKVAKAVEPTLHTRSAQGRDWVASGEFPLAMHSHAKNAARLMKNNVPVKLAYPKEGVVLLPFAPIILDKAPHPNAAKLFIDFARSAKGTQVIMDSGAYLFFGRPGVKSPFPEMLPAWEDINVIKMDWDVEGTREAIKNIRKDFKDAGLGF